MKNICPQCSSMLRTFTTSGPHIKMSCRACSSFIKFVTVEERTAIENEKSLIKINSLF